MAASKRLICASDQVVERKGMRFTVERSGEVQPAFLVRYRGRIYAFLNRCAHISVELDWIEGEFFDLTGLYLVCSTHGATYLPDSGACVHGPCGGRGLVALAVEEIAGSVYLVSEQ